MLGRWLCSRRLSLEVVLDVPRFLWLEAVALLLLSPVAGGDIRLSFLYIEQYGCPH